MASLSSTSATLPTESTPETPVSETSVSETPVGELKEVKSQLSELIDSDSEADSSSDESNVETQTKTPASTEKAVDQNALMMEMVSAMKEQSEAMKKQHELAYGSAQKTDYETIPRSGFDIFVTITYDKFGNPIRSEQLHLKDPHMMSVLKTIMPGVQTFFQTTPYIGSNALFQYYYELVNWEKTFLELTDGTGKPKDLTTPKPQYDDYDYDFGDDYDEDYDDYGTWGAMASTTEKKKETGPEFSLDEVRKHLADLVEKVREDNAHDVETMENMIRDKRISYQYLPHLFSLSQKFLFDDLDHQIVGRLTQKAKNVEYLTLTYQYLKYDHTKKEFVMTTRSFVIYAFGGTQTLSSLTVKPLTEKKKEYFAQRGQKYTELVADIHHLQVDGFIYRLKKNGQQIAPKRRCVGRVVIDDNHFHKTEGRSRRNNASNRYKTVPPREYDLCYPYLTGMDLHSKMWGDFMVTDLQPINYRDDAFDLLCLDDLIDLPMADGTPRQLPKKELIRQMVMNHEAVKFEDLVDGKSSGLIALLYGPPGVGKTLTAEVTAEVLHRPLYKMSVGELGTNAATVERTLSQVLRDVKRWNAVLLLDEADIFMVQRTEHTSMEKNSVVGVFLRELETHDGIIFLTSNRADCLDWAISSRIHLKMHYPDLPMADKQTVFAMQLRRAGMEPDTHEIDAILSAHPEFNGRNLKNLIRMTLSLAHPETPTYAQLKATVELITSHGQKEGPPTSLSAMPSSMPSPSGEKDPETAGEVAPTLEEMEAATLSGFPVLA